MRGLLHLGKRNESNVVGLAYFFECPANAHVTRESSATIGRLCKGGDGRNHALCDCASGSLHRRIGNAHSIFSPRHRHQHGVFDAGFDVVAHEARHFIGRADEVDRLDHPLGDCRKRAVAIARGMAFTQCIHFVGEACAAEHACVAVRHRVVEEIAPRRVRRTREIAYGRMNVSKDPRVAAASHLRDCCRHVRHGDVVQQHAVGDFTREFQHLWIERRHDNLRTPFAESHRERKTFHLPEVTLKRHRLAGKTLAQQRHVFTHHRDRPFGLGRAVLTQDTRRRHADAKPDVCIRAQRLQRCRRHRRERWRTQLNRHDTGREIKFRRHGRRRTQQRERIGAGCLDGPQRTIAELRCALRDVDDRARSEHAQAAEGDADGGI